MPVSYDKIYSDTKNLIRKHKSREPKEILENRGVFLLPFSTIGHV